MTDSPSPRDTLLTGMGFCLPGSGGVPTRSREDFWETISTGAIHLGADGHYFGTLPPGADETARHYPEVPASHLDSMGPVHHHGLAATASACDDAGLDRLGGDLADAAVLCARASSDSWFDVYDEYLAARHPGLTPAASMALYIRLAVSGGVSDLAGVQGALLHSGGPCHTVSLGCASGSVAVGDAARLIADGQADVAVVTGAEHASDERLRGYEALREHGNRAGGDGVPLLPAGITTDSLSRPYDTRTEGVNLGSGAVTLVLESREHAERRGARAYARIAAQANRRVPGGSALGGDMDGTAATRAARWCLERAGLGPDDIDYVNGGADGSNPDFSVIEAATVGAILGDHSKGLPVTVQEASFGHCYAALSLVRVAATALMIDRRTVCPTAGCEEPVDTPVDPLPGGVARPRDIRHALSLNYYVGSGASVLLLSRER